jgi:hypothetical protein
LQGTGFPRFLRCRNLCSAIRPRCRRRTDHCLASPCAASVLAKRCGEQESSIFYNTPSGALCYDGRGGMKTPCSIMFLGMESGTALPSHWRGRCAAVHMPCACCARRPLTLRESAGRFRMFVFWNALLSFFIIHRAKFA